MGTEGLDRRLGGQRGVRRQPALRSRGTVRFPLEIAEKHQHTFSP